MLDKLVDRAGDHYWITMLFLLLIWYLANTWNAVYLALSKIFIAFLLLFINLIALPRTFVVIENSELPFYLSEMVNRSIVWSHSFLSATYAIISFTLLIALAVKSLRGLDQKS